MYSKCVALERKTLKCLKHFFFFLICSFSPSGTSKVAQMVKRMSTMWETWVRSLGWEDALEKEMASNSSNLALKIPWMEELGAGYSPWDHKEPGMTERLHFHFHHKSNICCMMRCLPPVCFMHIQDNNVFHCLICLTLAGIIWIKCTFYFHQNHIIFKMQKGRRSFAIL